MKWIPSWIPFIGKKKDEKDKKKRISENIVHIKIKRFLGKNVPLTIASFDATQIREEDYNLRLVDESGDFKEDVTIVQDKIIDFLKYKLDLSGKDKEAQLKTIVESIQKQEKKLKDIKNGVEGKKFDDDTTPLKKANLIDEDNKLEQLKVLKFCVENTGEGSYEEINEDGVRQMSFYYMDGILTPVFHNSTTKTLYPDIGSKRKIYKSEQDLIDREYLEDSGSFFNGFVRNVMVILFILLFIGNIYWTNKNMKTSSELARQYDEGNMKELFTLMTKSGADCTLYWSKLVQDNAMIVDYALKNLNQSVKKEESIINDGNNVIAIG